MEEELLSGLNELRKYKTIYRHMKGFVVEQKEKYEETNGETHEQPEKTNLRGK